MIQNLLKMIKGALGVGAVHNGNSAIVLKEIPNEKIDCIVTDPPYGYSFMGKDWDKAVPAIEIWRECYRILKPGAFMFVMSAPRQDVLSEMIVRISKAGFDTSFTSIYWTYATGFPKAMNIAKAVDKRFGVERTVVGTMKTHDIRNNSLMEARTPEQKKEQQTIEIEKTVATSPQAKSLDGSYGGFQPKPAVEIIIVAMKPLSEKTFVDQALKNGKGITWLDDGRIPLQNSERNLTEERYKYDFKNNMGKFVNNRDVDNDDRRSDLTYNNKEGRFPANLLVSDDCLNDNEVHKSGTIEPHHQIDKQKTIEIYGEYTNMPAEQQTTYGNSGSFSRYFDLDAWFSKTIEDLPENVKATFPFLIVPKASKSERNKGCEDLPSTEMRYLEGGKIPIDTEGKERERYTTQTKNFHPTVKPLKLMCYLITLGSRKGDVVLDPFNGSGTTCLAAKVMERQWIGVDISEEYCKIQSARLGGAPIVKHEVVQAPKTVIVDEQSKQQATETSAVINACPKCGNEMRKVGKNYYCVKVGCCGKQ